MRKICILFDLDGTLVDSEGLCNQAFLDLIPSLKDPLESLVRRYRGQKLAPILADIEFRNGHQLPNDFESKYRHRVAELVSTELQPLPGVVDMLESGEMDRCIASSGPSQKIKHALNVSGLAKYFGERIFSSYEVGSWKPDPGLFLHAAHEMGYKPGQCFVVEDSDVGVQAALAAGMTVFQYLPNVESAPFCGATSFSNMSQLPKLFAEFTDGL